MKQNSLKGQDIVVAAKLALLRGRAFTYPSLAETLGLATSQVHASLKLLIAARLAHGIPSAGVAIHRELLTQLIVHGVPYFFPPQLLGQTRGVPTEIDFADPVGRVMAEGSTYVWPHAEGTSVGTGLVPLHTCVTNGAILDGRLYGILSAIEFLRVGAAREREIAVDYLHRAIR